MAFNHFFTRVLATLSVLYTVLASPSYSVYNGDNFTVAVNVPQNGTDDLFFHFHASSQYSWAAFGFGTKMAGSLIFVAYSSANGQNVTVSPRIASGNSPPTPASSVTVHILNGTGIQDGYFVVNAHCVGCRSWTGGKIDVTSQTQSMIRAVGPQGSVNSDALNAPISQHGEGYGVFNLDLKSATGEPGVPNLQSSTQPTSSGDGDGDVDKRDYVVMIHALLMIGCFLFLLPAGYLFLRVFDKVPLHAGVQALGVVFFIGGLVAGIVCNVEHHKSSGLMFSYHQVLGIVTSLLVFGAFTLGLISHQHFKKHKVSSPLKKFHRMTGPGAITFGWGTTISGFVYAGRKIYVLPYVVVLLAVVIFVGGITFLMQKRRVRSEAMKTPAAQNFHTGYFTQSQQTQPPSGYAHRQNENVPMQTFSRPFAPPPQHQQAYPYPIPGEHMPYGMKKEPDVNVRPLHI